MLGRYSSEIRTGCANERPSGAVRGASGNWCPYRDLTGPVNVAGRVPCVTSGRYEGRLYFFPARIFAHLALCAAAIRLRPAADNLRLVPGLFAAFAVWFPPPSSRCNTWFKIG